MQQQKIPATILTLTFAGCLALAGTSASLAGNRTPRGMGTYYGLATYYGHSGAFTAAHRTLPFGSVVRVTNRKNGRTVLVRIADRGPMAWTGRTIDLSLGAARALDMIQTGVIPVSLVVQR